MKRSWDNFYTNIKKKAKACSTLPCYQSLAPVPSEYPIKEKTESELSFEEEKAALPLLVVVYFHGYYALSDLDEANGLAMILSID
jgi:hypothetical protein